LTQDNGYYIDNMCTNTNEFWKIQWEKIYLPYNPLNSMDTGVFSCNKPHCASNTSIVDTFQWLEKEYILPLNISVVNLTTTRRPTTTTVSSPTSTTTPNNASFGFGFCNSILLLFFVMIFL
ncbi:unnamed protein product, partial [Adineta ricciae]